jgi:hypothetical protein
VDRDGAAERVPGVGQRVADAHHLDVLRVRVVDLPVPRLDLPLEVGQLDQTVTGQLVHPGDEFGKAGGDDEVDTVLLELLDRLRRLPDAREELQDVLVGEVRVLLGT